MNKQAAPGIESTTLAIKGGIEVELLNYGATLKAIRIPVDGDLVDVLLTYQDKDAFLDDAHYLGATVGRYAGRIDSGRAEVAGRPIRLVQNESDTGHCLHGGSAGFSEQYWSITDLSENSVCYEYVSIDGDQGFPGCLKTRVRYSLVSPMSLQIDYMAETDQETIINLSNHAYFNLGTANSEIVDHELWINSDLYTPLGENNLPTGDICHVTDSVFDFRKKIRLGDRLGNDAGAPVRQLQLGGGYDHYFLLNKAMQHPALAASVTSPESGICMKLYTDQPGVQFYSGNFLGHPFGPRTGLCLEFQDVPNAPNMEGFPSTQLKPGETYRRQITLKFES